MSLYLGENCISAGGSSAFRNNNIGEIIQSSIPLTDAGLHLLDGGVVSGSGSYSAFVTYIAGLVSSHSELFTTEANWQTAITNYGVCGKFVYDSVNNTVRLPKITGFTEGTIDTSTLGDLTEAGLPNITGSTGINVAGYNPTGCFFGDSTVTDGATASRGAYGTSIGIDVSTSSSIYGNSNTVQPQSIKVLYYIVIATSVKTEIEVDIDEVMTDLNGKADVDLSNTNLSTFASNMNTAGIRTVVETWNSGTEWYRVWSDGWCEQGGTLPAVTISAGNTTTQTLTFHKQMADTNYTVLFGALSGAFPTCYLSDRTVNGGIAHPANRAGSGSSSTQFCWEVKGYCVV